MPTVLVIGDVMTDIVVRPDGPIAIGADRRAKIRVLPGGSGANQACWLAGEGIGARFAARVGASDHARQVTHLAEYGVDARLGADAEFPTGTLVMLVSPDGERSFLTDRAANLNLGPADLPHTLLDGVDLIHISGYALFEEGTRNAVLAILGEVRKRGIPFSVDPSSYSFLQEVGAQNFLGWIAGAVIFVPNAIEAEILSGESEPDAQLDHLARLFQAVAIKLGAAGAIAGDGAGGRWRASAPPARVVDTSGAGDAFLGGFLAAHLRGEGIGVALKRGVELGSRAVATLGGRPAVPAAGS